MHVYLYVYIGLCTHTYYIHTYKYTDIRTYIRTHVLFHICIYVLSVEFEGLVSEGSVPQHPELSPSLSHHGRSLAALICAMLRLGRPTIIL